VLDRVRVHDGDAADRATRSIGARAFAYGSHIVFGRGEYRPHSREGRRTIAHEIGHVATGDSATAVHANGPRDHHHDAVRMQTAELTTELETMLGRLADTTGAEHDELRARVDAFRAELNRRSAPRDLLRELVARQRERIATEEPSAIMQLLRARAGAEGVFYAGIYAGFQYEFPPGLAVDGARELVEHPLEYAGGYVVGLLQGIWHGFVNLLEGLWTLVRIAFEMSIAGQAISFLSDPSGYIAARRRELALARRVGRALRQFGDELRADPTVLVRYGADLGFAIGQEFANMYRELVTQTAYEQGRRVGDVVGQIVFEILLEILLAIATEGIGNLLRGVAATGQAVRAGGRLARALRAVIEASPALRNLLRALTGAEDLRVVGRGTEVVSDLASTERRAAGAGERGADIVGHGDELVRHADDAPLPSSASTGEVMHGPAVEPELPGGPSSGESLIDDAARSGDPVGPGASVEPTDPGLATRGVRPAPGERATTRAQYEAAERARRASRSRPTWGTVRARTWREVADAEIANPSGRYSPTNLARMMDGRPPRMRVRVRRHRDGAILVRDVPVEIHHTHLPQRMGTPTAHEPWNLTAAPPWAHEGMDPFRHTGYELLEIIRGTNRY
jgi:hypothetical protein